MTRKREGRTSHPQLTPAVKRSLADEVADRLRAAIFHGAFRPGDPLREEQLATMLDVSRGPVREALIQLERERLVLVRRNRGASVARLSRDDVDEVYSLRLALERLAVQRAVLYAGETDFAALRTILTGFEVSLSRGPSEEEIADLDVRFHDVVFRAARHQRLYECWSTLRSQIYIFLLSRNVANPDFREVTLTGHTDLLTVLQARDETRAAQVLEEHLRGAYDRIITALPK
jgi:DNA-binding GntR family transcriptional regulator